jgi:archaellum component FlaC
MEKKILKQIGKSIPNELVYSIYDDIEDLKKMKSSKRKDKEINKILDELNEISSIAEEALNDTKSDKKKEKIKIFIEYNNKRKDIINQYKNTGTVDEPPKEVKECPPGKILNPKTNRCIKDTSANRKKIGISTKKDDEDYMFYDAPSPLPSPSISKDKFYDAPPIPPPLPSFRYSSKDKFYDAPPIPPPLPSFRYTSKDKFYDAKEYFTLEDEMNNIKKRVSSKKQKIDNLTNFYNKMNKYYEELTQAYGELKQIKPIIKTRRNT